ncbi:unknown [Acidaminococcus sp. CAG:917]|nr:unknown [Acidaminococcus sp. CAG:917]
MINLSLNGKDMSFENVETAINFIAFEHYPLTVKTQNGTETFSSFDNAKDFLISLNQ